MRNHRFGFTIVELLVVIVVIGILASIIAVSYNRAQAETRDAKRTADLQAISDAITAYRLKYSNQVEGSTCTGGSSGSGDGWFNYVGGTYTKSILSCLNDKGYLTTEHTDPSGCGTTTVAAPGKTCSKPGYAYMKDTCLVSGQTVTVVMARLELSGNVANLQGTNTVCSSSSWATTYGMNYMVKVQ
jgi:prepilin-type N-terminal cleavage/methylation domain-containing protein